MPNVNYEIGNLIFYSEVGYKNKLIRHFLCNDEFFSAAIQVIKIKFMPLIVRELFQVYITLYVGLIIDINRIIGQENFFYRPVICLNRCFHMFSFFRGYFKIMLLMLHGKLSSLLPCCEDYI